MQRKHLDLEKMFLDPSGAQEVRAAGQAFLDMRERIQRHLKQEL